VTVPRAGARRAAAGLAAVLAGTVAFGAVEARRLRCVVRDLRVPDLPPELEGLRLLHLSDVHAGHGPGLSVLAQAVEWSARLRPDIAVITGDLVARPRGERRFRALARELGRSARLGAFAILGNHDLGEGNDPFSAGEPLTELEGVALLGAEQRTIVERGRSICFVGVDAAAYLDEDELDVSLPLDAGADLRVLLCHYPLVLEQLRPGDFQIVLAGHIHGGQICLPWPGGRIGLAHPSERYLSGIFERPGTVMHVSPGLGTTFLPLRILAPPEATLLVLRPADRA
jgi:predicted MPP superfamily phosphohydrolase